MIAKKFRFHGYGSLKFVYSKGDSVRSRFLAMKYIKNTRRSDSRLSVVVSKKVAKKSPTRNTIRRRIYEVMRLRWSMIEPGYDMVITVFDERIATIDSPQLQQYVEELLSQAKLYKD